MIKVGISLKNMEGFDAQLDEVLDAVSQNLDEVATTVFQSAKTTSAFSDKTGNLRRRIAKKKSRFDNGFIVEARAPHAHLVEYGHNMFLWGHPTGKRVRPHPFMRPAKEAGLRRAIEVFRSKR